jgi:uncharacterized membrane protein
MKAAAKEQIKGSIGILLACYLVMGLIASTGIGGLFVPAILVGFCMIYLNLAKGIKPTFGDMFNGANLFGRALWLDIITQFFIFLWSLLLIVPGIIKSLAYAMGFFVLAENPELTARQALGESKRLMKGNKMRLFILMLSFIPWFLLVGITFGIAMIYVAPYFSSTLANFYNSVKETPQDEYQEPPQPLPQAE